MIESTVQPNKDAEMSVIGSILIDPDEIMPHVSLMLDEHDFLVNGCRMLYKAFKARFLGGKPIDPVTALGDFDMSSDYKLLITTCVEMVPSTANWQAYAQMVLDTAKKYRAASKAHELTETLRVGNIDECRSLAVKICENLSEAKSDLTYSAQEGFFKFYASLQKEPDYIKTGLGKLDERSYIQPGKFVVVGARPSVGKTAFALQVMLHMSRKRRCAFFSLETANNGIQTRIAAHLGGINNKQIMSRVGLDYRKLAAVHDMLKGMDYHIVEAAGWTVDQIKAKAVQLGAEVIFVDYLQIVKPSSQASRYEKVTDISMDLHTLALQSNMAVIALSQLKRLEGSKDKAPTLDDLRESGQIEQDADIIYLLHSPGGIEEQRGSGPTDRKIIIAKNKDGEVGGINLKFFGGTQTFSEVDSRYD